MPWAKVDDKLYSSPKWLAAPARSRGLWVTALSWSMDRLTDGHVPTSALGLLGGRKADAEALVAAMLWEHADGGYQFHDWAEYQPDAASIRAKRDAEHDAKSEGGKKGNHVRWHAEKNVVVPGCEWCEDRSLSDRSAIGKRSRADRSPIGHSSLPDRPVPVPLTTTGGLSGAGSLGPASDAHDYPDAEAFPPPARSLDDRWRPSERCRRIAATSGLDLAAERERFTAHARTHNRQVADWDAAFEGWLLDSAKRAKAGARPLDRQAEILRREMEAAQAHDARQHNDRLEIEA